MGLWQSWELYSPFLELTFGLQSRSFVSVVLGLNCTGGSSASVQ